MSKKQVKRTQPAQTQRNPNVSTSKNITEVASPAGWWWVGALASILGFVIYANTFGHEYCLDDFGALKENWVVKGGLKNLGIIFSTEYRYGSWASPGSLYRPLTLAMFALEWQMSPDNPMLYHLMNVLFYAFSGWVLWITWRRVLSDYPAVLAAMAVLFFMAHPLHTEVVANIKSRDEIVSLLCSTGALYFIWKYLDTNRTSQLVSALLLYGLSLFAKESSITFLALIPLSIWFFRKDASIGTALRIAGMLLIPAGIFLLIRYRVLSTQGGKEVYSILDNFIVGAKNPAERFASAFMMCWKYLWVLIFPKTLVSDMGYPQVKPVGFGHWESILGVVAYFGMGIWALLNLGRKHFMSFAILFYLAGFSLFSNVLMLIGTSYGERLQYIPSLGFALALAWGITKLLKIDDRESIWNPNGKGALVWGIAGVILLVYSGRTFMRNYAWKDSASLYAADLPTSPDCAKLNYHNSLEVTKNGLDEKSGGVLDSNQVKKGIDAYNRTIQLYPDYHDAYGSRGLAYFRLAQQANNMAYYQKAYEDYLIALKHRPNDAKVLSNMGYIHFMRGNLEEAERVYRESIKYDPRFIDARRNLGAVLAMKKQFPQAIDQWTEALKFDPNNGTLLFYIGSAYKDMGQMDKAQPWFDRAKAAGVGQ